MCLESLFFKKFLPQWLHCSWQTEKGGEWQVIWCLRRPQKFMIVGLQCSCLTSSWWKEPWSRSCRWRRQVAKGTQKGPNMPSSTTRLSSTIPYLLFPSISYSSSSSSFFSSSSSSSSSSLLRRSGKPPGPPSFQAGTYRTGTGLLLPKVPKYWQVLSYSQVTK